MVERFAEDYVYQKEPKTTFSDIDIDLATTIIQPTGNIIQVIMRKSGDFSNNIIIIPDFY